MIKLNTEKLNWLTLVDSREVAEMLRINHDYLLDFINCLYVDIEDFSYNTELFFITSLHDCEEWESAHYLLTKRGLGLVTYIMTFDIDTPITADFLKEFNTTWDKLEHLEAEKGRSNSNAK